MKVAINPDAPAEMREALEACKRDMEKEVKQLRLDAPDPETLARIVAAGPGEHQDRLFTIAVKKAVAAFFDRLDTIVTSHKAQFEAMRSQDGKGPIDRFLS